MLWWRQRMPPDSVRHATEGRYAMSVSSVLFLLVLFSSIAFGQTPEQQKPATKLEAFQARTGVVIVRGYTTVGNIQSITGVLTVDAREFRDASNPNNRVTGISVSVKETA